MDMYNNKMYGLQSRYFIDATQHHIDSVTCKIETGRAKIIKKKKTQLR